MKKLFIITIAVLFFAGAANAVDYDYSGSIYARGSYISNSDGYSDDAYSYMYYDMEFDSTLKINPTDKSQIYLNWEIHDENWESTPGGSDDKTGDDNIAIKRAFGKFTFDNGWWTTFGLMTGAAFGTSFADNADGRYRWRIDGKTAIGQCGFILEKNGELGNDGRSGDPVLSDWDGESDDSDAYYAYLVTKAGDVTLMFLGGYVQVGDATGGSVEGGLEFEGSDLDVTLFQAVAKGSMGAVGYEAEFDYFNYARNWDAADPDSYSLMGAYANVWTDIDAFKVGGLVAYGSWDEDAGDGFGFGEDFCPGNFVCDWTGFGTTGASEYSAVTLLNVYVDYAINEAMSVNGSVGYWMSNETESAFEDATGNELNLGFGYKLADNVKWSLGFATGAYDLDEVDTDSFMRAYHKLSISF